MTKFTKTLFSCVMALSIAGCGVRVTNEDNMSHDDAVAELTSLMKKVPVNEVKNPTMDIYSDEVKETDVLADIDTFDLTVVGDGDINIELAGATEMTGTDAPDDFLTVVAKKFNRENHTINGKKVTVSVRKMASGEVLTYVKANAYHPDMYVPSASMWGDMMVSSGVGAQLVSERLAGDTAGVLMKKDVYNDFIDKYKEATLPNILTAAINGDVTFAYTNPYTSTTGLNGTAAILNAFDSNDMLSDTAAEKMLEYQKTAPPVAYTTTVLRNQAEKGLIDTMLMEAQAYTNSIELKGYEFIPFGIRHDHPVYTFDYCSEEKKEAVQMFTEYCLNDENQKLATEKGFNQNNDYKSVDYGLDGTGWMNVQKVWKQSKNGGKPVIAVFVADVSGSMDGEPLNSLKSSLVSTSSFISSDNYIGLVSYSDDVTINLPIEQFDAKQRAYFSGEVKNLTAGGMTATYDAVLTALNMMNDKAKEVPDAKMMLFVLSDGIQNEGYKFDRIKPVVAGMDVPVYSIAYNYDDAGGELYRLSSINEAALIKADSDDVVNQLRNLFKVEM